MEIRQSQNRLIYTMGFPLPKRRHQFNSFQFNSLFGNSKCSQYIFILRRCAGSLCRETTGLVATPHRWPVIYDDFILFRRCMFELQKQHNSDFNSFSIIYHFNHEIQKLTGYNYHFRLKQQTVAT